MKKKTARRLTTLIADAYRVPRPMTMRSEQNAIGKARKHEPGHGRDVQRGHEVLDRLREVEDFFDAVLDEETDSERDPQEQ